MINCHIDESLPSSAHLLPSDHPRESYRIAIQQLQLSSRVVDAIGLYLALIVESETVEYNNGPDAAAYQSQWGDLQTTLSLLPISSHRKCYRFVSLLKVHLSTTPNRSR